MRDWLTKYWIFNRSHMKNKKCDISYFSPVVLKCVSATLAFDDLKYHLM